MNNIYVVLCAFAGVWRYRVGMADVHRISSHRQCVQGRPEQDGSLPGKTAVSTPPYRWRYFNNVCDHVDYYCRQTCLTCCMQKKTNLHWIPIVRGSVTMSTAMFSHRKEHFWLTSMLKILVTTSTSNFLRIKLLVKSGTVCNLLRPCIVGPPAFYGPFSTLLRPISICTITRQNPSIVKSLVLCGYCPNI